MAFQTLQQGRGVGDVFNDSPGLSVELVSIAWIAMFVEDMSCCGGTAPVTSAPDNRGGSVVRIVGFS